MNNLKATNKLLELTQQMETLILERREALFFNHYQKQGHYKHNEIIRAPIGENGKRLRKGNLTVANCIACPVEYDDDFNPTYVLCWVPQENMVRWLRLEDWRFDMKKSDRIPSHHMKTQKFVRRRPL
jgi:hypothetical protein